jgi:hypothetical protein
LSRRRRARPRLLRVLGGLDGELERGLRLRVGALDPLRLRVAGRLLLEEGLAPREPDRGGERSGESLELGRLLDVLEREPPLRLSALDPPRLRERFPRTTDRVPTAPDSGREVLGA